MRGSSVTCPVGRFTVLLCVPISGSAELYRLVVRIAAHCRGCTTCARCGLNHTVSMPSRLGRLLGKSGHMAVSGLNADGVQPNAVLGAVCSLTRVGCVVVAAAPPPSGHAWLG